MGIEHAIDSDRRRTIESPAAATPNAKGSRNNGLARPGRAAVARDNAPIASTSAMSHIARVANVVGGREDSVIRSVYGQRPFPSCDRLNGGRNKKRHTGVCGPRMAFDQQR